MMEFSLQDLIQKSATRRALPEERYQKSATRRALLSPVRRHVALAVPRKPVLTQPLHVLAQLLHVYQQLTCVRDDSVVPTQPHP